MNLNARLEKHERQLNALGRGGGYNTDTMGVPYDSRSDAKAEAQLEASASKARREMKDMSTNKKKPGSPTKLPDLNRDLSKKDDFKAHSLMMKKAEEGN